MSTIVSEKAVLGFGTDVDSKVNVTLYDPKSDLTAETVSTAMDTVVGMDVLQDKDGNPVSVALSAKKVTTTEQSWF